MGKCKCGMCAWDEECNHNEICDFCEKEIKEEFKVDIPNDGYSCFCSKACAKKSIIKRIEEFIY